MPDIPRYIIERARADAGVFTADEVAAWQEGTLEELVSAGAICEEKLATSVTCDACGDDHIETVQYIQSPPNTGLRAYIPCPQNGRVIVPLDRLRRWRIVSFEPEAASAQRGEKEKTTIIQFVAGDRGGGPKSQIQVAREEKGIRDAVALGLHRNSFAFSHPVLAASIDNLIACHRNRPAILHFVGHGEERRMVLVRDRDLLVEMQLLEPAQVETLFTHFLPKIRLVVFNTCRSLDLARHVTSQGVVDLAIGVEGTIPDDHAIRFAVTFYGQLADGRTVQAAFNLAGLQVGDLSAKSRPQLFSAVGVQADSVSFASGT